MSEIDSIVQERLLPMYKRVFAAVKEKHPHLIGFINTVLGNNEQRMGLQITEHGKIIGEYTIFYENMGVNKIDPGVLHPEIHTPFGVIKPYAAIEKSAFIKMLDDEQSFIEDPFKAKMKYISDVTVKFLR